MVITYRVLLEPRGFIKVLEFIFVICAFACCCNFRGQVELDLTCPVTPTTPQPTTPTSTPAPTTPPSTTKTTTAAPDSLTTVPTTSEGSLEDADPQPPNGSLYLPEYDFEVSELKMEPVLADNIYGEGDDTQDVTSKFKIDFKYPFNLQDLSSSKEANCSGSNVTLHLNGNFKSPSTFYVFVGVTAFLYTMFALFVYVFQDSSYKMMDWIPLADLAIHAVFTVLWFAGSIAFASALTSIKQETQTSSVIAANPDICYTADVCREPRGSNWQLLDFSVVFGFLDFAMFGVNCWFVFKETKYSTSAPHPTVS